MHKVAPTMNSHRRNSTKLRRSRKDTAPGPNRIRNSDIKNPTEEDRAELHTIYQECFHKGYIPEDCTNNFLKSIPKARKVHHKLNGYSIFTIQNTSGKLMEYYSKLAIDLED